MFAKMKTGTKVLAGFAVAIVIAVVVGGHKHVSPFPEHFPRIQQEV